MLGVFLVLYSKMKRCLLTTHFQYSHMSYLLYLGLQRPKNVKWSVNFQQKKKEKIGDEPENIGYVTAALNHNILEQEQMHFWWTLVISIYLMLHLGEQLKWSSGRAQGLPDGKQLLIEEITGTQMQTQSHSNTQCRSKITRVMACLYAFVSHTVIIPAYMVYWCSKRNVLRDGWKKISVI